MPNEKHVHSYVDPNRSWIVYERGQSQIATATTYRHQQPASNNRPMANPCSSKAYRDTGFWGKDKMTYDELTMAWERFNKAEELKALYFTQSEVVDHILAQAFQNVNINYEDLDGLRHPNKCSRSCNRSRCGCKEVYYPPACDISDYGTPPIASPAGTGHAVNSNSLLPPIRTFPSGLPINPLGVTPSSRSDSNT